ncbi:MAG TPA: HAD family hydrolase [Terracidiphilus sp.]|nr:HAD family hydrolase [Terracidiphilus sp.]
MDIAPPRTETRIAIQPGFHWDRQDAYLFDIDGTILRCRDRVHIDSVAASVQRVTGFEITLAGIALQGNTDTGILREACLRAGIPAKTLEAQIATILDAMCQNVAERRTELRLELMPGIEETLSHLARRGAILGVATGNLELIGWIKIETAGLREWFRFGGFSDHFPVRSELIDHAARKARELAGTGARVCVVGDTPRDIEAAHANSLPAIAVATGHSTFDALLEHRPEVCATSLADLLAASRNPA